MNKNEAREVVWSELVKYAKPDSRFHMDFNEYIPDFDNSEEATARLTSLDAYKKCKTIFITPDNCLDKLRAQVVRDKKTQIITTYGIRRGFVELAPDAVPEGLEDYAVLLDAIEKFGKHISLAELKSKYTIDMIVTGASAVNMDGVRFGKGHGFFDIEWAILYQLGVVNLETPITAFVHDSQLVDIKFEVSQYDTLCDLIVTPTRTITIGDPQKPTTGIIWEKLKPNMMEDIPPLQELKQLLENGRS